MTAAEQLRAAIGRLLKGDTDADDRALVREAIEGGLILATGERAVSLGGSADGAVIATGDDNVILKIDAAGAEAIQALLRTVFRSRRHQLPPDLPDFEGRTEQTERLLALLAGDGGAAITALGGMGGLGKTALAVHIGHLVSAQYPDGQILVPLAGTSDAPLTPEAALTQVIRAFEPAAQLPDSLAGLQAVYAAVLDGRRVLLILDDAGDGDQVAPLRPPLSCDVIVTSRQPVAMPGLVAVDLDVMPADEAIALLQATAGEGRATDDDFAAIGGLCGGLPLALRVAGTFLQLNPVWSAEDYIAALGDERERLARLTVEGHKDLDVAASLNLSVRQLAEDRPDLVERWRLLSVFPSDFAGPAAAVVWDVEAGAARDDLQHLVSRSLLLFERAAERFRLHDLMRDLAGGRSRLSSVDGAIGLADLLGGARARHASHYLDVLRAANALYLEGNEGVLAGLALYDLEEGNIGAGWAWAVENAFIERDAAEVCMRYPALGIHVISLRLKPRQQIGWLDAALGAAREIGDRGGVGAALATWASPMKASARPGVPSSTTSRRW